jgi:hypothetical protein
MKSMQGSKVGVEQNVLFSTAWPTAHMTFHIPHKTGRIPNSPYHLPVARGTVSTRFQLLQPSGCIVNMSVILCTGKLHRVPSRKQSGMETELTLCYVIGACSGLRPYHPVSLTLSSRAIQYLIFLVSGRLYPESARARSNIQIPR